MNSMVIFQFAMLVITRGQTSTFSTCFSQCSSYSLDQLQELREEENQQQDENQGQDPADELERHCQVGLQQLRILLEILTSGGCVEQM